MRFVIQERTTELRTVNLKARAEDVGTHIEIKLGNGHVALVDHCDLELVERYAWQFRMGYAATFIRREDGKKRWIMMHRLILKTPPGLQTDHINHDRLDNRRCNIRVATAAENAMNRPPKRTSLTGYKGVRRTPAGKYVATIAISGTNKYLGTFPTAEAAAREYNLMAQEFFGPYCYLNLLL